MIDAINKKINKLEKQVKDKDTKIKLLENQLEIISNISRNVVSDRYLQEILNLIVVTTAKLLNSKICSIMLLDEQRQEFIIQATQSLSEEYKNKSPVKVEGSITGEVIKTKQYITVADARKDPRFQHPDIAKKLSLVSMIVVPMLYKDKIIGTINVYTSKPHKFNKDEISILQTLAVQAGLSIENTKLLQETLAIKESLETRKSVERAKGILMKELILSEQDAYRTIQKKSMDSSKPMKEIAEAIILSYDIKKV